MSAAATLEGASTALRSLELRSRRLPLEAQMSECVDLLQTPEIVVDELVRSVEQIRTRPAASRVQLVASEKEGEGAFFYPSRELFVNGDGCSFTCLATSVDFEEADAAGDAERAGASGEAGNAVVSSQTEASPEDGDLEEPAERRIDYAAVTCEARPVPVLGFAQSTPSESAYPLLLRALATLIELTRPRRFDLLDREVYRGLLGPAPVFDLALVLWDDGEHPDPRRPLCELSRDLAEVLKSALAREPRFPPILNDVVCLRLNQQRFDGRLRFVWRV